ncbi:hypothetical protein [Natrialba hulunbeirensis]|uniref:hypothetical protein n=1 Tax=Natrialba hulunbeirensis TaxID=123783 RepID=UPI001268073F|nr:hypothetical protein [Natrialba hulunbeirensis]
MSKRQGSSLFRKRLQSTERDANEGRRGQINPQFILGAFVLIVLAGPLATIAIDLQSAFASAPGFSWLSATVIALLIVAAMVAAALGIE